jgi:hypothetical protein
MLVSKNDRTVLQELAAQLAEIAALPVQQETIALWTALNGLKPERPMVMIGQIPWHEMEVDGELALQTQDPLCRRWETTLRRTLYCWRHMRADMVVEPYFDVPRVIRGMGFGMERHENTSVLDPENTVVGHYYLDQLQNEKDLQKIQTPHPVLDEEATAEVEAKAHEVFDGTLEVRMQGATPVFSPWDQLVQWHGVENTLMDLAVRPEFMHAMIKRYSDALYAMLDQLEEQGLLGYGQSQIHCTGAHTDELPAPGFDVSHPRPSDLWTYAMAQVFVGVSPAMHKEFELDYAQEWAKRFGLVYYGCCEPLHEKIDIIRELPHVRKISMSPWVDVEVGAQRIGGDYVFSRKPSPALLAPDVWSPAAVEADLRETKDACARHGCPLEFILKDISTVRYRPQRLWEWVDVATKVAQNGG